MPFIFFNLSTTSAQSFKVAYQKIKIKKSYTIYISFHFLSDQLTGSSFAYFLVQSSQKKFLDLCNLFYRVYAYFINIFVTWNYKAVFNLWANLIRCSKNARKKSATNPRKNGATFREKQ
jgi:hypothetical protein